MDGNNNTKVKEMKIQKAVCEENGIFKICSILSSTCFLRSFWEGKACLYSEDVYIGFWYRSWQNSMRCFQGSKSLESTGKSENQVAFLLST